MHSNIVDLKKARKAYGSYTKIAERLGVALSTVHGWHIRKHIPKWRAEKLAELAEQDGHDVMPTRRKRKAA